ncbi:MAG: hypothetical protein Fur0025_12740 [Oscillatoriaceae cyanobacterium]
MLSKSPLSFGDKGLGAGETRFVLVGGKANRWKLGAKSRKDPTGSDWSQMAPRGVTGSLHD